MKDFQEHIAQEMDKLAIAVDSRLVQNDQRNGVQDWAMVELYTALRNLATRIEVNTHDNQQINPRFIDIQQRMERLSNEAIEEFGKSIGAVARKFGARFEGGTKGRATSSCLEVKSDVGPEVLPCLGLGVAIEIWEWGPKWNMRQ